MVRLERLLRWVGTVPVFVPAFLGLYPPSLDSAFTPPETAAAVEEVSTSGLSPVGTRAAFAPAPASRPSETGPPGPGRRLRIPAKLPDGGPAPRVSEVSCLPGRRLLAAERIFRISVSTGGTLGVSVEIPEGSELDPAIYLLRDAGDGESCLAAVDDREAGAGERFRLEGLAPGTYFLGVDSAFEADLPQGRGAFEVVLEGDLAPGPIFDDGFESGDTSRWFTAVSSNATGAPCFFPTECASTFCVDRVCCVEACGGDAPLDCLACSLAAGSAADGTCSPLTGTSCTDGIFCNGLDHCDGSGACALHAGDPCAGPDGDYDCSETCNETNDDCSTYDPAGSACTDLLFCTGADQCNGAGACAVHADDPCPGPDGDADCSESCNETSDTCTANDPAGATCLGGLCDGSGSCIP